MTRNAPSATGSFLPARASSSERIASIDTASPRLAKAMTTSPSVTFAKSSFELILAMSARVIWFGFSVIEIVSLKGVLKGMLGGGQRVACVYAEADATPIGSRIARAVMRFEDSPLGAAFGVALLFGLVFALLHIGGAQ